MKKRTVTRSVLLLAAALCLLLGGCSLDLEQLLPKPAQQTAVPSEGFDHAGYDWLAQLKKDAFAGEESMAVLVEEAVQLQITATTDSTVTVKVKAPDIADALLQWYDSQEEFSGEAMEAQIQKLLKGKKTEQSFTLTYTLAEDVPVIIYPDGYANALSCGLSEFYDVLYGRILEQMGGTENG